MDAREICVEVAYATPARQFLVEVRVGASATLRDAILASGVLSQFPQIDLATAAVGVFGRPGRLDDPLRSGDRVEIYRPLAMDPKDARRKRAKAQPG